MEMTSVMEARQPALNESWSWTQLPCVPEPCLCAMTFFLPSPGRIDAEYSHPSEGSPHPESHGPLSHVFPHRRPHTEGKASPALG